MKIEDAGSVLCNAVARGDSDYLKRLLSNGMDPNTKDYDYRSPLHVAAAEGLFLMAKLLIEAEASVFIKDRWGNTPIDEARLCGNKIDQAPGRSKVCSIVKIPSSLLRTYR
ncbi:potassium channel GORK-like [Prosopis cineraria]|uniref:potassium channel GORK-like n=1 Tax=Prosopis cineraria TaxID=364024 RepID=UPI00241088E9|nr:potassium channel GORK-like [Prosopis cineraria]